MPSLLSWYYNSATGALNELPTIAGSIELHLGLGWHGPFSSQADAVNYYNQNSAANPGWKRPTGVTGVLSNTGDAIQSRVDSSAKEILGGIDLASWFLRIGEILLGIVLIAVGVAKLTGTTNMIASAVKARI